MALLPEYIYPLSGHGSALPSPSRVPGSNHMATITVTITSHSGATPFPLPMRRLRQWVMIAYCFIMAATFLALSCWDWLPSLPWLMGKWDLRVPQ